jgi:hypothetical protein
MKPTNNQSMKPNNAYGQNVYMDALGSAPDLNTRQNIISGPGIYDNWNHSPGYERPEVREQGPWPPQGNIGSLLLEEASNNFQNCSTGPSIGSGPNCTNTFYPNIFQTKNNCTNCALSYPASYGDKDFGQESSSVVPNDSHILRTYENKRVGSMGTPSDNGCMDWIPRVKASDGFCTLDQYKEYRTVGAWDKTPEFKNITSPGLLGKGIGWLFGMN